MRILVVDDDAKARALLRRSLLARLPSSEVVECDSLEGALATLDSGAVDVVVADVVMESPDAGWQLARRARAQGIPVLLASGVAGAADLGDGGTVPLVSKLELTGDGVADLLACVIATQGDPKR